MNPTTIPIIKSSIYPAIYYPRIRTPLVLLIPNRLCASNPYFLTRMRPVDRRAVRGAVRFWPTRSLYTFVRFSSARDIAEFGPVSPDPAVAHASRSSGTRNYDAAEVLAMAFRLAAEAAGRG